MSGLYLFVFCLHFKSTAYCHIDPHMPQRQATFLIIQTSISFLLFPISLFSIILIFPFIDSKKYHILSVFSLFNFKYTAQRINMEDRKFFLIFTLILQLEKKFANRRILYQHIHVPFSLYQ